MVEFSKSNRLMWDNNIGSKMFRTVIRYWEKMFH